MSILKPIKGLDAGAYENFASFCRQDYAGSFDIHFAVADPQDPATQIIAKLQQDFPELSIRLLVAPPLGANPKIASLHALAGQATGDILVISDGHIRVGPDYLSRVTAPLADPTAGLVTCAYRGLAPVGLPARLAVLHMSGLFLPAVALAHRMGQRIGMGATVALRRGDLLAAGGFAAVADHMLDDYEIVRLIEQRGLRTVLSPYVVGSVLGRVSFRQQWVREVRWARGIRLLGMGKYTGMLVTWPIPWAFALLISSGFSRWGALVLGLTLFMRWIVTADIARRLQKGYANLPLLPVRELMSLAVWCAGAMGCRITWRGQTFVLRRDGRLEPFPLSRRSGGESGRADKKDAVVVIRPLDGGPGSSPSPGTPGEGRG
ncbi:MAG TPA: glycosyltransferase, partial [Tepidisphaeraceae bacterium]|nr:glycosyltransferase [Tepidisphaeraceae bacterium]